MTKGKCTICSLNDQTLCDINYTIKQHATTVLGISEFQLKSQNINICLRCQFNLELAFKINKHVALFFKHGAKLTTECILCRRSSLYLLNVTETKENTESFVHKIAKCTEQENINLTGQQKVCYRCLYFTDVWFDLRSGFEGETSEDSYINNNNSLTMKRSAMKKIPPSNSKKQKISSSLPRLEIKNLNIQMNGVESTNVPRLRAKPSLFLSKMDTSKVKSPKSILPASKIIKKRKLKCREKFDEKLMNRVCLIDVSYNTDPKKLKRRSKIQFSIPESITSPQTAKTRSKVVSEPSPIKSDTLISKRVTRTQNVIVDEASSPITSKKTKPGPMSMEAITSKKTKPGPMSMQAKPSPMKSKKTPAPPVELKTKPSKSQSKKSTSKQKESQPPLPSVQKPAPKSKKKSVSLPKISTPKSTPKKKTLKCSQCIKTFAYDYELKLHEFEHTDSYSPKVEVYKSNLEQMRKLWFTNDDSSDGEISAPVLKQMMKGVDVSKESSNKIVPNSETDKSNVKTNDDLFILPDSPQRFEYVPIREVLPDDNTESNVNNSDDVILNISDDEQESSEKTSQNENNESNCTDSGDVNPELNVSGNTNSKSDEGDGRNSQLDKSDDTNSRLDDCGDANSQPDECGDENSQTNECEDSQTNECGDGNSQTNECDDSQTNECGDENSQTNECEDSQTNECEDSQTNKCGDENLQTAECDDTNRRATNDEENCCVINDSDDEQTGTKKSCDDEENAENNQNFPPKKRIRLDETDETDVPNDMGNKSTTIVDDNSLEEPVEDVPNYASSINDRSLSMAEITETLQELGA